MYYGDAAHAYRAINNILNDSLSLSYEEYHALLGMKAFFFKYLEEGKVN